jgi:hypothetical protein
MNSPTTQQFLTGSGTYVPSSPDVRYIRVSAGGGGASGGSGSAPGSSGGGGGGAGAYFEKLYSLTGYTYTYTIGTGGGFVATNANGIDGGNTFWTQNGSAQDIAGHGYGGNGVGKTGGGYGGSVFLTAINLYGTNSAQFIVNGGDGNPGSNAIGTQNGGNGGSNTISFGGMGGSLNSSDALRNSGQPGRSLGGGGGGGGSANNPSGYGQVGFILVEEFY